jgi:hypothetical protein
VCCLRIRSRQSDGGVPVGVRGVLHDAEGAGASRRALSRKPGAAEPGGPAAPAARRRMS